MAQGSDKKGLPALLLCFFLGSLGIHRFYVGKIRTGILWLVTGEILGIGWLIDHDHHRLLYRQTGQQTHEW